MAALLHGCATAQEPVVASHLLNLSSSVGGRTGLHETGKGSNASKGAEYDASGGAVDDRSGMQKVKDTLTPGSSVGKHTQADGHQICFRTKRKAHFYAYSMLILCLQNLMG